MMSALPPIVGAFEAFTGDGPSFDPLPEAVDGDDTERVCATAGAAYPQVASASLQVAQSGMRGWLGRWLHRKRRTP